MARKDLKKYHKKGPHKTTRFLLNWIEQFGENGLTLLDVGGGVGMIQHELLKTGVVETAVHVDGSPAYLQTSREEAQRLGHEDKIKYQHGNFVDLAPGLETADIVTLDRVLCCYHDMPALLNAAAKRSNKYLGLVFPRDRWWFKSAVQVQNLFLRLTRNPFRLFIHSTEEVENRLHQLGFQRQALESTFIWQSMIYVKASLEA